MRAQVHCTAGNLQADKQASAPRKPGSERDNSYRCQPRFDPSSRDAPEASRATAGCDI